MARASSAFENINCHDYLRSRPDAANTQEGTKPWAQLHEGELPPMMFQLRFTDGQSLSYAYSDIRTIRCRDAGHLELLVYAPKPLKILIEGRHLRELAQLLGCCMVRWIEESNSRRQHIRESDPEVTSITAEPVGNSD
jgi:hypothetical protein